MLQSELDQKKSALKDAYPHSSKWHEKVDHMPEQQVVAVYLNLVKRGKIRV